MMSWYNMSETELNRDTGLYFHGWQKEQQKSLGRSKLL
jgi:rhamnogalacturonyl hydrolase YesR